MERDRSFPPKVLRWSELKHMARSPAHFRAAYTDPPEQSPAMRFGALVHALALRHGDFAVFEGERRAGKEWDRFRDANPGKMIVKASEVAEAQRVVSAVETDPVAAPLLRGLYEHELEWEHCGRRCAGRLDILHDALVDLKTTNCAEPAYFSRAALRLGYHAQAAHYSNGARANGHDLPHGAFIIAVETSAPFAVTVMHITPRTLEEGQKLLRSWLERVIACEAAGEWPGYRQTVIDLEVPEADGGLLIDGEQVFAA